MKHLQHSVSGRWLIHNPYVLLTLSALLSSVPLYVPPLFWLVFVSPISLFYAVLTAPLSARHGFWWALLCWLAQLYALFFVFAEHAHGKLRLFIPVLLIVYCAAYGALAFYLA